MHIAKNVKLHGAYIKLRIRYIGSSMQRFNPVAKMHVHYTKC